ncbi:hypothetical protein SOVF_159270 [Spinacia oleracea]|nr:hypothetical protein SOVF_159270 [Spinacia oleracea]
MEQIASRQSVKNGQQGGQQWQTVHGFQMPVHYPKYSRADYEVMPEWRLDCLLNQYGLPVSGDIHHKRNFVIGAFLW